MTLHLDNKPLHLITFATKHRQYFKNWAALSLFHFRLLRQAATNSSTGGVAKRGSCERNRGACAALQMARRHQTAAPMRTSARFP